MSIFNKKKMSSISQFEATHTLSLEHLPSIVSQVDTPEASAALENPFLLLQFIFQ